MSIEDEWKPLIPEHKEEEIIKDLERLINRHSIDSYCQTPDFLLAEMVMSYLADFANGMHVRENWFGRTKRPIELNIVPDGENK